MTQIQQTIFAPATNITKAGIAIIRISGPQAQLAFELCCNISTPIPGKFYYRKILSPFDKEIIDNALIVFFKAPHSFTGENIVEMHVHGSIAIINKLLHELGKIKNFRLAEPGEFSKQAFLNNKMDLTQADGLADLIDSETELQRKQALRQVGGNLQQLYNSWRNEIVEMLAHIEAYIDFPDEEIPSNTAKKIQDKINILISEIKDHLYNSNIGQKIKTGLLIAIIGKPNVGKSSLINYLAKKEVAIVSNHHGTTRDVLEAHLVIKGVPVTIADTAGIRENADEIEAQGIKKAKLLSQEADLKIIMFDATDNTPSEKILEHITKNSICVINKCDLNNNFNNQLVPNSLNISLKHNLGIKSLEQKIENFVQNLLPDSGQPLITQERYKQNLANTLTLLENFSLDKEIELSCQDLREAALFIANITGAIKVDDILDRVFGNFCLGK